MAAPTPPTPQQIQDLRDAIRELNALSGQNYDDLLNGAANDAQKISQKLKLVESLIEKLNDETDYLDQRFKSILNTIKLMIPANAAHYQGIKSLQSEADNLLRTKRGELDVDFKSTVVARDSIKLAKEYLEVEKKQREETIKTYNQKISDKLRDARIGITQNNALYAQELSNINANAAAGRISAVDRINQIADALKKKNELNQSLLNETKILQDIRAKEKEKVKTLEEQQKQADILDYGYRKALVTHIKINKELGLAGASVKALDALTKNMGIPDLGFENAYQDTLKAAQAAKEAGKSFNAIGHFTNIIQQNLVGILDPIQLTQKAILELYKATIAADKSTGELAKSFGISYAEAASLRNELNTIANLSADININTASLQKALIELNKQFGTAIMLNGELLKDYTRLTEVAGYTAEAAASLSKITVATGTDLSENTAEILGQAVAFNAINKLALNEKEIVEAVAKTSAATTLSLGMQPGKIAEANLQAKALGTTLEKVEQIASSLLQFESSIEAELSAELLIGKDLYLERARLLALNNDLAGAAEEIAKQIGTAADFTNMNVIQQEALAKAVGMTREDLAKSLIEREALAAIGEGDKTALEAYNRLKKEGLSDDQIALKLGDDKLAAQLKSQSIQERFNKSVEKLQEIFVSLAEPILQIVSPLITLASTVMPAINFLLLPITSAFKVIGDIVSFIDKKLNGLGPILKTVIGLMAVLSIKSIRTAIGSIYSGIFSGIMGLGPAGPFIAAGLAIASVAGMYQAYNKANDMISPGYGKRTLLAPEGAIALNDKDTVIAGTKLFKGNDVISAPQGTINMPPPNPQPQPILVTINNSYDGTQFETARNISRRQIQ